MSIDVPITVGIDMGIRNYFGDLLASRGETCWAVSMVPVAVKMIGSVRPAIVTMNFSRTGPASFGAVKVKGRICTVLASFVNLRHFKHAVGRLAFDLLDHERFVPAQEHGLDRFPAGSDRTELDDRRRDGHVGLDPRLDEDGNLAGLVVGREHDLLPEITDRRLGRKGDDQVVTDLAVLPHGLLHVGFQIFVVGDDVRDGPVGIAGVRQLDFPFLARSHDRRRRS